MNATIENSVIFLNNDEMNHNMLIEFNYILQAITTQNSRENIEKYMKTIKSYWRYFNYGFGSNHMWVHQKSIRTPETDEVRIDPSVRIIFVEF